MRRALAASPSLERRRRTESLLDELERSVPAADQLRSLRAVEALEQMATPAAREVLERLAEGAPRARLTGEVKAAVERLARRPRVLP